MNKIRKCINYLKTQRNILIPLILSFFVVVVAIYNLGSNTFFAASFTTLFSIMLVIWLSYYFSQRQTDSRKQKEILLNMLYSLQELINDETLYKIPEGYEMQKINMKSRTIRNRIHPMDKHKEFFGIAEEIDFINNKMREYDDLIGKYYNDTCYLSKASEELLRPLSLINDKIFDITIKIYM